MPKKQRKSQDESGAIFIEAAIALPILFLMLLWGVDLVRMSYHSALIQDTATRAARDLVQGDNTTPTVRASSAFVNIENSLQAYGIDTNNVDICITPLSGGTCSPGTLHAGNPGQFVHINITYRMRVFFNSMEYVLKGTAGGRNEKFSTI